MRKELLDLEHEIEIGQENAKKAKELYQLLSSYNAYSILLLKAKREYEKEQTNTKQYYSNSTCYGKRIDDLFLSFRNDECLTCVNNDYSYKNDKDRLFLIDSDTLLRLYYFENMYSVIENHYSIDYEILKINNCVGKVYNQSIYCGDPYYCDTHYEDKEAFGLFYNDSLITPSYALDNQLRLYDNMDIREILKPKSLDEIYDKITIAKNKKVKKLVLS